MQVFFVWKFQRDSQKLCFHGAIHSLINHGNVIKLLIKYKKIVINYIQKYRFF